MKKQHKEPQCTINVWCTLDPSPPLYSCLGSSPNAPFFLSFSSFFRYALSCSLLSRSRLHLFLNLTFSLTSINHHPRFPLSVTFTTTKPPPHLHLSLPSITLLPSRFCFLWMTGFLSCFLFKPIHASEFPSLKLDAGFVYVLLELNLMGI